MNVLGIVCSPRQGGNTEIMVSEALKAAGEAGMATELFHMAGKRIAPCDGCNACLKTETCKLQDDMRELYHLLEKADGIVFGSPVYFFSVSAQAKIVIDRTYPLAHFRKLRGKAAAAIVTQGAVGASQALSLLYTFFITHRMTVAGGGIGFGRDKGAVREGAGGSLSRTAMEEARAVGKNIVRAIRSSSE